MQIVTNDPSKQKKEIKKKINLKNRKRIAYIKQQKELILEEEKEIKKYEKLLKLKSYKKQNKLPKSFYLDGLADLIEFCEGKFTDEDRLEQMNDVDFESESDKKEFETESKNESENAIENEDEEEFEDSEQYDSETMPIEPKIEPLQKKEKNPKTKPEIYEDIYGFLRDQDGNIIKTDKTQDKKLKEFNSEIVVDENLQRKLRGLINRLSSSNLKVISKEIIEMNRSYGRHVIYKGIMNCIDSIIIGTEHDLPSKLVAEIAMLISVIYFEIGDDVGGFFLHSIVKKFEDTFNDKLYWNSSKKLNNIITLILNIYSTGLIDCHLIYEILDKFCQIFENEKSIEIIDLILKTSGFLIRKDDPSKMKALILQIQAQSKMLHNEHQNNNRIKFILENLIAIKNNNVSKIKTTQTIILNDLIESTLKAVIKKNRVHSMTGQYLAILQSPHWYLFNKEIVPLKSVNKTNKLETIANLSEFDHKIRDKICRSLRINTPLRRDLITVLFSCNDYLDAAGKLITIGKKQSSEVMNVVLHVAINEKTYNNFYFYLLRHLSNCNRKYKVCLFIILN